MSAWFLDSEPSTCNLKLNYNPVVCGIPNLIELCYFLAYKKHFVYT